MNESSKVPRADDDITATADGQQIPKQKKVAWKPEEDKLLRELMEQNLPFSEISIQMGTRSTKQCRERLASSSLFPASAK